MLIVWYMFHVHAKKYNCMHNTCLFLFNFKTNIFSMSEVKHIASTKRTHEDATNNSSAEVKHLIPIDKQRSFQDVFMKSLETSKDDECFVSVKPKYGKKSSLSLNQS